MNFSFSTAPKIIFGSGTSRDLAQLAGPLGTTPCLVTGSSPDRTQWAADALGAPLVLTFGHEPDTVSISAAAEQIRAAGCDVVVAIGGGSVLDAGKMLAALATNTADIMTYLEVVGDGQPLTETPLPLVAVPTTSGTGSEVTANGVVLSVDHGVKVSMRSTDMLANIALVDPELTVSLPPTATAATGLDALTQLMEGFVTHKSNPLTDSLCREGIIRVASSLEEAVEDGTNMEARENMALGSLFSGIVLANAKLGAVHGFAAPLGGMYKAPHGQVCGCLLPHVMEMNIHALETRDPESPALEAYQETAVLLTGEVDATPGDGVEWVRDLCEAFAIPRLRDMDISREDFPAIAEQAARSSSMQGNPIVLTQEELETILDMAY